MKRIAFALTAALLACSGPALSIEAGSAGATPDPLAAAAPAHPLFPDPVVLRGTLGDRPIQASLHSKADEDGFEGEYQVAGDSRATLLAGELAGGDDIFMEESVNGKDVSGQWSGKLKGDKLSGTWQSADGMVTKPFSMTIVRTATASSTTP